MIWIKNKSCDAFSSKRLGECGRKRLESQHDHPENSHDCCGGWVAAGGMVVLPSTATDTCMPTIRITATTGIGITKQIAAEGDCLTTNQ
jgi:hypothetical protein